MRRLFLMACLALVFTAPARAGLNRWTTGGPFGGTVEVLARLPSSWAGGLRAGQTRALTGDTGYAWFFQESNVEVLLKVLDGCGLNGRFWVFAAGLTDVEVRITVLDTQTGEQKVYVNPRGTAFRPILDTSAFAGCG